MPTNRTPIERRRRPLFDAATLALFAELERVPERERRAREFRDGEHELMRRLHLVEEFWGRNSVLDRAGPCYPAGHLANRDWQTCRRIRRELLAAARMQFGVKENAPARTDGGEEDHPTTRPTGTHS